MLCKHHFSKNGQVFFHIFWVVTLLLQSRNHHNSITLVRFSSTYRPQWVN
ncbi:hypothetical protein HMPREF0539_0793 [Lacticaseibacillus rhamnosus LMS2-1]|uniref:Uncharacterized protein n=1 Tax=Lacticaseibacillus rhamnosus (strain LMS2-1) TaxID=525361 RepID=C2JV59_LACRM|nr:hypothetical protein HMPREF0539_0793 [Lacticaseibacillus rhamnosus LMS2-1]